jgi:hypothetical protein
MELTNSEKPVKLPTNFYKNIYKKVNDKIAMNFSKKYLKPTKYDKGREYSSKTVYNYLEIVEREIAKIAKQFNHFGLLVALHHAFPPIPFIYYHKHFTPDSQACFNLAILSAMKYCSSTEKAKFKFTSKEYLSNPDSARKFSSNLKIIKKVFEIEELCLLFHEGKKIYHLAEKGSRVIVDRSRIPMINTKPSNTLSKLTHEYDDRNIKEIKRNILTISGSHTPLPLTGNEPTAIPIVNVNWDGYKSKVTNNIVKLQWVNAIPFYGSLYLLREEVQNLFRNEIYIEDLITFILCSFDVLKDMVRESKLPYGLGYDFTSTNNFEEYIVSIAPDYYKHLLNAVWNEIPGKKAPIILESTNRNWWRSIIHELLDFVSLSEKESSKINLKTFSPVSYLFKLESENTIFMAFNCISPYLVNLWRQVPKDGKFHNLRGTDFEIAVNNTLVSYENIEQIWDRGKKLHNVGRKKKTDLDVFVGLNDFAFPISCKAHYLNDKYLEGNGQEYFSRWEDATLWLRDIEEIGKHLVKRWKDYKLPKKYKYVIPIVCTTSPLYVWKEMANLRLPNDLPRICTLSELSEFLRNFDKHKTKLIKSNFTLKVI